jgi:hypothetical protein
MRISAFDFRSSLRNALGILALCTVAAAPGLASVTSLDASARGWLCDIVHTPCNLYGGGVAAANPDRSPLASYFVGAARTDPASGHPSDFGIFRNWFAFQIPLLDSPLVSATLTLPDPNRYGTTSFTYTIYGMTSQPQVFADVNPATLQAWGTVTTTPSSLGQKVVLNLNAAGVAAIWNAQGNTVYFGGIDSGEFLGLYNADFSNTGEYDTGVDLPVHSILTLNTTATANVNTTCAVPAPGFANFQFEHPVSFTGVLSTLPVTIPASVAGPIFSGQAWIRERLTYDNSTKILVTDLYTVPVGTVFPTPSSIDIVGTRFGYLVSYINNVYLSCTPRPSAFLTGWALDGANLYGLPDGSGYALGFGFTTDNPPVIRDIGTISAGIATSFDGHAIGTLNFLTASVAVTGAPVIATNARLINLSINNAGSTGGPFTSYQWSTNGPGLAFLQANSPSTPVLIDGPLGDYTATLTVTNGYGQTASTNVTIRFTK